MSGLTLSPVGLLLATATSVSNVFADVSRKKVMERNELVAATFWVRVFAALVFTVAIVAYMFAGSPPVIHVPVPLTASDIKDLPSFSARLKRQSDEVSRFIVSRLSETNRQMVAAFNGSASDAAPLLASLLRDLNGTNVIRGTLIYEERRFAGVKLSTETHHLMAQRPQSKLSTLLNNVLPQNESRAYLNLLLLEDAYPQEIAKDHNCGLFGTASLSVSPMVAFLIYLTIDVVLIGFAQILLMRALQISPMSLCIPFMAFTPVFLIPTSFIVNGEMPPWFKLLGVGLIVVGSLAMHRKLFSEGWTAPIKVVIREKGSRYILLVAFILSLTNPIEKRLVTMSDPATNAFSYCVGLVLLFAVLAIVRRADLRVVMRTAPRWAVLAGVMDAAALLLQFLTYSYLDVVITVSIKRAGIVLSVLSGWLIFREREITDKLIAASVMLGGVLILYLPLQAAGALVLTAVVSVGMGAALYVTRRRATVPAKAESGIPK
jgi:drug/metabolite transporter (DMT)-like permease